MGKTYQSIVIDKPAGDVWATVRDFHDVSWANPVLTSCEAVGDKAGDQMGAKRVLNDAFHETLVEISDLNRALRYSIDDGPAPVSKDDLSDYVGALAVHEITEGGGSFVEWSSSWEGRDDAAVEFCHTVYVALLGQLKQALS
ncbi:polyketide cyclase [Candidatus Poribacteria bacterium]|nr:polyketide cyclase [Candidatus Poribacteria bacterium]